MSETLELVAERVLSVWCLIVSHSHSPVARPLTAELTGKMQWACQFEINFLEFCFYSIKKIIVKFANSKLAKMTNIVVDM